MASKGERARVALIEAPVVLPESRQRIPSPGYLALLDRAGTGIADPFEIDLDHGSSS